MESKVVEFSGVKYGFVKGDGSGSYNPCKLCRFEYEDRLCASPEANICMDGQGSYFVDAESDVIKSFTHNGVQFDLMVAKLVKPGEAILATLSPEKADALHMAVGVAGEAGELLDAIKKYVVYNKDLDRENVVEELGDLEFYMEGLRRRLRITREETMAACIDKLGVRYKDGYSDKAAQERADKQ